MKTIFFKVAFIFLLSFTLIQTSNAYGRYYYHCAPRGYYYAPRAYYGPRYIAPAPYYGRVLVPGHYFINRWGHREFVRPYYR